MPRLPLVPTLIVGLAVATMIALGVWQLERRGQKAAAIAQLAANADKPEMAFPALPSNEHLFRRAAGLCLEVVAWRREGGRAADGTTGWRQIAECRTGAEGPGLLVDVGVTSDPKAQTQWKGGEVSGTIAHAPDPRSLIAGLFDRTPRRLLLIADQPAPGLQASAKPGLESVPNNHLAYAVQWFVFALVAGVIYVLALRWRGKNASPPPP